MFLGSVIIGSTDAKVAPQLLFETSTDLLRVGAAQSGVNVGTGAPKAAHEISRILPLTGLRNPVTIRVGPFEGLSCKADRVDRFYQPCAFHLVETSITETQDRCALSGHINGQTYARGDSVPFHQVPGAGELSRREQIWEG